MIEINNLTKFAVDKKSFSQVAKNVLKGENRETQTISLAFVAKEEIKKQLDSTQKGFYFVPASQVCKDKLQNEVVCTMYLLGYAVGKELVPLKKESALRAIKNVIPAKYLELNINAFELGNGN